LRRRWALPLTLVLIFGGAAVACTAEDEPAATNAGPDEDGTLDLELVAVSNDAAPLGEAFGFTVRARNSGPRSVSIDVALELTAPAGDTVPFTMAPLFVPFGGEESQELAVTPAQWFADTGRYEISAAISEPEVVATSLSFDVGEATVVVPEFEDVTGAAGLTTTVPAAECGQFANGAAWGDVEGDGDLDLLVTRLGEPVQLFVHDGGVFTDEAGGRGVTVSGANGASFADYDNDGDVDLVIVRDGSDVLLRNDGSGRFVDVSTEAGIGDDDRRGISASWGDFDADGYVDLYVTNYMQCTGPWDTEEEIIANVGYYADTLYRNNGDGTFSDVSRWLGEADTNGAGFAATWFDYNDDNRLDLYLANDFVGVSPDHNHLWRNDGPAADGWKFTDVSDETGTAFWMNSMGIALGDVERDGDLDLALSNITANKLVRNDGGAFVEDLAAGIGRPLQQADVESVTWGGGFHDLNLDGWEDLYFAAGNFAGVPTVGEQPNELFVNPGADEPFHDVSAATGADDPDNSKGVAFADYDGDGRMDLFVVNQGGAPRLLRNVTPMDGSHWLQVDTVGTVSNRDGCGARVVARTGDAVLTRQVSCGSTSVASGNQTTVHFGLGSADVVDELEILWPSGTRQRLTDVSVDQLVVVEEDRT
jgi:enediyne biosynthesis protein E4